MRAYELMVIHRPDLAEADVRKAFDEIQDALRSQGAEVKETDFWGKRRFAYEIEHLTEGYYSVVQFDSDVPPVEALSRSLGLSDTVLRHKIVRYGK